MTERVSPAACSCGRPQGTVWPWLFGPFVEAWVRAHGDCANTRARARKRFLNPFTEWHFGVPGRSHIAEIADAEAPFTPRGCPFQNFQQDGHMRMAVPKGRANYQPNSWGEGPRESPSRGFRSFASEESGPKLRIRAAASRACSISV